jgi:hypothetical protein
MNEHDLARRIVQRLDHGLDDIDPRTLAKLRAARAAAVERMQLQPVSVLAWAGAAGPESLLRHFRHFNPRYLLPIVGMVLAVSGMVYWQEQQRIEDPVEIDAKLLSSDLPIDALLDKGLDTWLQR